MIKQVLATILLCLTLLVRSQVPVLQDEFRLNLDQAQSIEEIEFFQLEYRTSTLDFRGLMRLTEYKLPQSIVIVPPELHLFEDVVVLVGLSGNLDNPSIIIWLAGNYSKKRITFFIDMDQDRDFTNDKKPIKMQRGDEPIPIILTPDTGAKFLTLSVPADEKKNLQKEYRSIPNGFSASMAASVGTGKTTYSYDDLAYDFPSNYKVRIAEKSIKVLLTRTMGNIQLGVNASFQNHFYYTSNLTIKKGEPIREVIPDPNLPGRTTVVVRENMEERINDDIHPSNRIQWGVHGSYRFQISKTFSLQPVMALGLTSYLNPEYTRLKNVDNELYSLPTSLFYETGIRSEFLVGIEKAVYFEIVRNSNQWNPDNFLANTSHENFTSSSNITKLNIGYRLSIP